MEILKNNSDSDSKNMGFTFVDVNNIKTEPEPSSSIENSDPCTIKIEANFNQENTSNIDWTKYSVETEELLIKEEMDEVSLDVLHEEPPLIGIKHEIFNCLDNEDVRSENNNAEKIPQFSPLDNQVKTSLLQNQLLKIPVKKTTDLYTKQKQSKKRQYTKSIFYPEKLKGSETIKSFECTVCGKVFNKSATLTRHIRIHTGEKPYECPICNKKFTDSGKVKIHIRLHTGEQPYHCDLCSRKFPDASRLNTHKRTHTGERPYECNICKKTFGVSSTLNRHMRSHSQEKPFTCKNCSKSFKHLDSLRIHMVTHMGQNSYQCSMCKQKFANLCQFTQHLKMHVNDEET